MHRPVILYEVPDGPQDRDYQCSHYHDCVSRVSLIKKAQGFTCVDCPSNSNAIIKEEEHTEKGMLISVPPPCTLETVPLENIILDFEIEEAFFRSLADSVNKLGVVIQPVMLIENGRTADTGSTPGNGASFPQRKREWRPYRPWSFQKAPPSRSSISMRSRENMNRGPESGRRG